MLFGQGLTLKNPGFVAILRGAPAAAGGGGNVTFDTNRAWQAAGPSVSGITYLFTNGISGLANPYMLVGVSVDTTIAGTIVSSVTANSALGSKSLTLITNGLPNNITNIGTLWLWGVANPDPGSNQIVVVLNNDIGSLGNPRVYSGAATFYHVASLNGANRNTGSGTAPATAAITTTTGDMAVGIATTGSTMSAWPANDIAHLNGPGEAAAGFMGWSRNTSSSSVTFTWTATDDYWVGLGINLHHD